MKGGWPSGEKSRRSNPASRKRLKPNLRVNAQAPHKGPQLQSMPSKVNGTASAESKSKPLWQMQTWPPQKATGVPKLAVPRGRSGIRLPPLSKPPRHRSVSRERSHQSSAGSRPSSRPGSRSGSRSGSRPCSRPGSASRSRNESPSPITLRRTPSAPADSQSSGHHHYRRRRNSRKRESPGPSPAQPRRLSVGHISPLRIGLCGPDGDGSGPAAAVTSAARTPGGGTPMHIKIQKLNAGIQVMSLDLEDNESSMPDPNAAIGSGVPREGGFESGQPSPMFANAPGGSRRARHRRRSHSDRNSESKKLNLEVEENAFEQSFEMEDGVLKAEGLELRRSGINIIEKARQRADGKGGPGGGVAGSDRSSERKDFTAAPISGGRDASGRGAAGERAAGGESRGDGARPAAEAKFRRPGGNRQNIRLNPDRVVPVRRLGSGAGGSVLLAVDIGSFALRAVKQMNVFDKSTRHQMLKEIKTFEFARTSHPNIVSYHGGYYSQGEATVALEYMNCGSLGDLRRKCGAFSEDMLKSVSRQVLLGLNYLHARKIIHRDIKPENILVNDRGCVKLADFGLVKELQETAAMANTYVGTAKYMSPERIMSRKYSYNSDVWSLGLTIAFLATDRFPFDIDESQGIFGLAIVICKEDPRAVPRGEFSDSARDFVRRCMIKDPEERPSSRALLRHAFVNGNAAIKLSRDWPFIPKPSSTPAHLDYIRKRKARQMDTLARVVNIVLNRSSGRRVAWDMLCRSLGGQLGLPPKTVLTVLQAQKKARRAAARAEKRAAASVPSTAAMATCEDSDDAQAS